MKDKLTYLTKIIKGRIILSKILFCFLILFFISFKMIYFKMIIEYILYLFLGTKFTTSKLFKIPRIYDFKKFKILVNEPYPVSILENLIFFYEPLAKKFLDSSHYYLDDFIKLKKKSTIIDAGAYTGDTSIIFQALDNTVYAFEPDEENYKILLKNIEFNKNLSGKIIPVNLALYSKKTTLYFMHSGITSKIIENNLDISKVQATSLDDFVKENNIEKVDFIKSDLEGSEKFFLEGAKNTLKTMKPSLAICSYHYEEDPIVLKKIILDANPSYIFYQTKKILFAK